MPMHGPDATESPAPRDEDVAPGSMPASVSAAAAASADLRRALERAMHATMDGIAVHDARGRFLWLNDAHARAYGYTVDELLGRSWETLYDPEEARRFAEVVLPQVLRHGPWRGTAVGRRRDGSPFPQEVSLTALDDGGLVCVVRDVSEAHATRSELLSVREAIGQIVESAPLIVFALDLEGRVVLSEGRGLRALGLSPGETVGRSAFDLEPDPEGRALLARALRGEPLVAVRPFRDRWLEVHYAPRHGPDGALDGVIGVTVDVTERRRAEEALRAAQRLESLAVLAGGVAHDFNNLLVGVLGNASLALDLLPADAPVRTLLERIELAGRRAGELTRQLLAYAGRGHVEPARLDLSALAGEMSRLLESAVSKGTRVETRFGAGVPTVAGDAAQLRQLVMNLVVNASEALRGARGTVTVTTSRVEVVGRAPAGVTRVPEVVPGTYAAIEVADTGCGMEPALRERIFDPFFTTKASGRGLGLAVVMGVARAHHGAVEVESAPGRGSRFRVLLPVEPGEAPTVPHEDVAAVWSGRGRVLVVDDEEPVRRVAAEMLERLGYDVDVAAGADEAVALHARDPERYAAVLLDVTMPGVDGADTVRRMRATDRGVRIVLMSGFDATDVLARLGPEAPRAFLGKPFTLASLSERLRTAVLRIA